MSCAKTREDIPPPPIPEGCRPLSHQVAGHIYGKCKTRAGLLQDDFGSILKLLQTNNRGTREKKFYEVVFGEEQTDPLLIRVRNLVCPFHGTIISTEDPTVEYIKLSDMTVGFKHPCIMDVKIGRIGYEDGGNSKKAEMAKLKYPHMDKLGFQVLGMRVYHPQSQKYYHYDKTYGRSLDVTSMIEGLAKFFNVEEQIRTDVMHSVLVRLQQILDWFQVQTRYHFYSSSLLFIYEADLPPSDPLLKPPSTTHLTEPTAPLIDTPAAVRSHSTVPVNGRVGGHDEGGATRLLSEHFISTGKRKHEEEGTREGLPSGRDARESRKTAVGRDDSPDGIVACRNSLAESGESMITNLHTGQRCNGVESSEGGGVEGVIPAPVAEERLKEHARADRERTKSATNCHTPSFTHSSSHNYSPHLKHHHHHLNNSSDSSLEGGKTDTRSAEASHRKDAISGPAMEVRMIDFAHAIESTTRDENYIFGLRMLMQYIETLHNCYVS